MTLEHYAWGTPLHVAVWFDDFAAVGLLLDTGADPLAPPDFDDDTLSPLTLAARNGNGKIARLLWDRAAAQQLEELHLHRANDGLRLFLSVW